MPPQAGAMRRRVPGQFAQEIEGWKGDDTEHPAFEKQDMKPHFL